MARVCIEGQKQWASLTLDLQQRITLSQAEGMTPYLTRQTPLAVFMFRHTRATLRAYQERGMVQGGLARREPEDIPVVFQTDTDAWQSPGRMRRRI